MNTAEKEDRYEKALQSIRAMIDGEDDLITVLSTISCELYHAFEHLNWVGVYRRVNWVPDPRVVKDANPRKGTQETVEFETLRVVQLQ